MASSPYAVRLADLEAGVHVPVAAQVAERAVPRLEHPRSPLLWAAGLGAAGIGGATGSAGGCWVGCADGD